MSGRVICRRCSVMGSYYPTFASIGSSQKLVTRARNFSIVRQHLSRSIPPLPHSQPPLSLSTPTILPPQRLPSQRAYSSTASVRNPTSSNPSIKAKQLAAKSALVHCLWPEHRVIGIGSGSTIIPFVEALAQNKTAHRDRIFVPTGYQSDEILRKAGLNRASINEFDTIDICFDGADSICPSTPFTVIKGGGACHLQEKIVFETSKRRIIIVDETKIAKDGLGKGSWIRGIPLEVVPLATSLVQKRLSALYPNSTSNLRSGLPSKLGPCLTDSHHFILDFDPPPNIDLGSSAKITELNAKLKGLTGVVETGLFETVDEIHIGRMDGTVEVWRNDRGDGI